ncbi:MAG: MerR family transcriptional regulator [Chitinophagaceae bacterium]|nr:MerR family transcriptional regulator [Chitinophagaceae bacterium]
MEKEPLISIQQVCTHYNIAVSFFDSLQEYGLIEIVTIEETQFIPVEKIKDVERIWHLHDELDINLPGIEAITHLLQQIESMQGELTTLKNRLQRFQEE